MRCGGEEGDRVVGLGRGRGPGSWSACTEIEAGQVGEDVGGDVDVA